MYSFKYNLRKLRIEAYRCFLFPFNQSTSGIDYRSMKNVDLQRNASLCFTPFKNICQFSKFNKHLPKKWPIVYLTCKKKNGEYSVGRQERTS